MYRHLRTRVNKIISVLIIVLFTINISLCVFASETGNVDVLITSGEQIISETGTQTEMQTEIQISFSDMDIYNEELYLSYHVTNDSGDMIQYEGDRFHILLDENQTATIPIKINVSEFTDRSKKIIVIFDIVDQKNLFWFSGQKSIDMTTVEINYKNDIWNKILNEIVEAPVIFIFNAVIFISFCIIFLRAKDKF